MGDYIGSPQIRAYNADCLVGMSRVGTGTVDLILTDLPYGTTACPWDTVIPFAPLWEQYRRILKPKGALVLMATQPFATDLINSARKLFRYDLIWEKTGPVGHANAHRMPMRSHELILVFYQRLPKYNPQGLIPLEKPVRGRAASERPAASTPVWTLPVYSALPIIPARSSISLTEKSAAITLPRSQWT